MFSAEVKFLCFKIEIFTILKTVLNFFSCNNIYSFIINKYLCKLTHKLFNLYIQVTKYSVLIIVIGHLNYAN